MAALIDRTARTVAPAPLRAAAAGVLVLAALLLTLTGRGRSTPATVRLLVGVAAAAGGAWLALAVVRLAKRCTRPVRFVPLVVRGAVGLPALAFALGASLMFTVRGLIAGVAAAVAFLIIRRLLAQRGAHPSDRGNAERRRADAGPLASR